MFPTQGLQNSQIDSHKKSNKFHLYAARFYSLVPRCLFIVCIHTAAAHALLTFASRRKSFIFSRHKHNLGSKVL